jgi:alpha-tubulin suppressor-like RCC1 family protein
MITVGRNARLGWMMGLVAALVMHAPVAALADAGVVGWGSRWIGAGRDAWFESPTPLPALKGVAAMASGWFHSCAITTDGRLWGWGLNDRGGLGAGLPTVVLGPVPLPGIGTVKSISCGQEFTLAVGADGSVWAWGQNTQGQLGVTPCDSIPQPHQVVGLEAVAAVAAGQNHALALDADGGVWAWGENDYGQLGITRGGYRYTPGVVEGLPRIVSIAAGDSHSLAIAEDGTVWAWGNNWAGELGFASADGSRPGRALGLDGVTAISAGASFSVALRSDGTVWAWGWGPLGQIGDGTRADARREPTRVAGLTGVVAIASGLFHSMAVKGDGSVWTWGYNHEGQIGDGTQVDRLAPYQVPGISNAVAVAASYESSFALISPTTPAATSTYTVDRAGTIGESVRLRAYLRRKPDNAWLLYRGVTFSVDGSAVGSALTDAAGMAYLDWVIPDGPASRTLRADFGGDAFYSASAAGAAVTAYTFDTALYVPSRAAEIADVALLKAYLTWGPSHFPRSGKAVSFRVGGTQVGSATTNEGGRAMLAYTVPEGEGAGARPLAAEWAGDGGYRASAGSATLEVDRAPSYLWLASRSAQYGKPTYLRAYLRRLPDYAWLPGQRVRFSLNGVSLGTETTDAGGRASYLYQVTVPVGDHGMAAAFDGDGSYLPGGGGGTLTVTP